MIYVGQGAHALDIAPEIQVMVVNGFIISATDTKTNDWWFAPPVRKMLRRKNGKS